MDIGKLNPNTIIDEGYSAKWMIYLTNWGYTMCTFQAILLAGILSACILSKRLRSMPNLAENALKLYKIYWVTNTIATPIAFGITAMYWSVIYNRKYFILKLIIIYLDYMKYFVLQLLNIDLLQ